MPTGTYVFTNSPKPPKYLLHHLNYSIFISPCIALLLTSNSVEPCNPLGHRCLDPALECNTWQNSYTDHSVGVEITHTMSCVREPKELLCISETSQIVSETAAIFILFRLFHCLSLETRSCDILVYGEPCLLPNASVNEFQRPLVGFYRIKLMN